MRDCNGRTGRRGSQHELDWQQRQRQNVSVRCESERRDVRDQRRSDSSHWERQGESGVSPTMSRARSEQAGTYEDMLGDDDLINQERNRYWLPGSTGSRSTESSGEVEFVTASEDAQSPIMIPRPISDELTTFMLKPLSGEESKAVSKLFPMVFDVPDFSLKPPKLDNYIVKNQNNLFFIIFLIFPYLLFLRNINFYTLLFSM
ncbi:hypothetical protein OUZ56_011630 [Daphnia magna]|uniref:Uncharacterized protein n=1 Tax=Daphnia magna TaxID=35525 RepID=A0ABQ9Z0W0_9CRUS|nr:hypothetical protein OUZ56_011630 [Daphnia magna]